MTVNNHVEEVFNGAQVDERVYIATQLLFVCVGFFFYIEMGYVHSHLFIGSIHERWETQVMVYAHSNIKSHINHYCGHCTYLSVVEVGLV